MGDKKPSDQIHLTEDDKINRLLLKLVSDVKGFTEMQLDQIRRLTQIGSALSAERNLDKLLEMIVDEARAFTSADGGTLYIMSDDETELHFAIVQNNSLNIRMGGTGGKITWPSVMLKNPDGSPNHANVSAYAALTRKVVNIPDVYDAEGFNFEGTRKFDSETGYRSKSMLVVPMRNHDNDIIGVLQLLNAQFTITSEVISFSIENQKMTESLASQAAVALSNNRLIQDLENLLESIIRTIATAIDEKSPYTGGHVRRVAALTMTIAEKINKIKDGPYANVHFNDDQLKELRIAAWLHDVGKITTPEYIIDKSRKLETIYDRIETIKTRMEVIKRDHIIEMMRQQNKENGTYLNEAESIYDKFDNDLEKDFQFLLSVNGGSAMLTEEMLERINEIASRTWYMNGERQLLLNENELYNISILHGTLTGEEKEIIKNHATITYKMLSQLPFPKKMKNVSIFGAAHHERLDGKGYPLGLKGDQLPLQSRIIALADVFDALTAKDRPYKKEKTLSEAIRILELMAEEKYIDYGLFDLFIKERIHIDYGRRELTVQQIDVD
ncbi:MAG: HD domain-containing protein [Deltaproteobacteria bacterium]|nr:HD domain-containing protein [Deltaproteobacteria bacterium]